jgi:DNA repair exonuclease SbcCD ATPase subunit
VASQQSEIADLEAAIVEQDDGQLSMRNERPSPTISLSVREETIAPGAPPEMALERAVRRTEQGLESEKHVRAEVFADDVFGTAAEYHRLISERDRELEEIRRGKTDVERSLCELQEVEALLEESIQEQLKEIDRLKKENGVLLKERVELSAKNSQLELAISGQGEELADDRTLIVDLERKVGEVEARYRVMISSQEESKLSWDSDREGFLKSISALETELAGMRAEHTKMKISAEQKGTSDAMKNVEIEKCVLETQLAEVEKQSEVREARLSEQSLLIAPLREGLMGHETT